MARLGGCPLAEHGVGRNPVKQALLRQLYGEAGIDAMRAVKKALDRGGSFRRGYSLATDDWGLTIDESTIDDCGLTD